MDEVCQVVVTAPDAAWLAAFVRQLVDERLAAGAHIIEDIRSVFRWQGELNDRHEAHVTLHTRTSLVNSIVRRAIEQHPYMVPCVVAYPIIGGNSAYLRWIISETIAGEDA